MSVSLSAPLFSFESTYMVVAGENARRSGGGGEWEIGERNDSLSLFFCSHSSPSHSHSLFKTLFMYPAKRSFPLQIFSYIALNNSTALIYDSYWGT